MMYDTEMNKTDWQTRLSAFSEPQVGGCIFWTGPLNKDGYGVFTYTDETGKRHSMGAHKAAFLAAGNEVRKGQVVRHVRCHWNRCINPAHMAAGTQQQNIDDRKDAGTHLSRGGSLSGPERAERAAYLAAGATATQISERWGISMNAAYQWIRRARKAS